MALWITRSAPNARSILHAHVHQPSTTPTQEIERAVRYAEQRGWTVVMSSGHRWATILCTQRARDGCRHPVYSTPKNPEQHARRLVRLIDKCQHG